MRRGSTSTRRFRADACPTSRTRPTRGCRPSARSPPGLLVAKTLPDGWTVDLKYEFYRQKSAWKLGGDGSPGLLPFSANWIQAGVAKAF